MKYLALFLILFSFSFYATAQNSTEIYLFDINEVNYGAALSNPVNISNNVGYDNQPSFTDDGESILFASSRNGQTDILWYHIATGSKKWISDTPGGEYSPVLMPDGKHISAVRLDPDGLQLLYKYSIESGASEVLVPDLKIGYYSWFLNTRLNVFVLGDPNTLQEIDFVSNTTEKMYEIIGRSLHPIPETKMYSFIDKSDVDNWKIMRAVPGNTESTEEITITLPEVEDMVWLNMHTILMGKDDKLYSFDTKQESKAWQLFADLSKYGLTGITRLAKGTNKRAVVVSGI